MIWTWAALLTGAVLVLVLIPVLHARSAPADRSRHGIEVYKHQLAELEGDVARGVIDPDQAEAMRTEVGRRVLAADAARTEPSDGRPSWRTASAIALSVALPAAAFALYGLLGSPHLPDAPLAGREPPKQTDVAGMDLETLTARLAARLEQAPGDARGWALLGRSLAQLGRYREAAEAVAHALELEDGDAALHFAHGETLVFAAEGVATPAARRSFLRALEIDPRHPGARYYLGLADRQAGAAQAAYERWLVLAKESPPGAPWLPLVIGKLEAVAAELQIDLAAALPAEVLAAPAPEKGPDAEQMAAAAAMSADERSAMVRGMVANLAARLEEASDDFDGWLRLGRAYGVLGEPAKARDAYARAVALAPDHIPALLSHGAMAVEASGTEGPLPEAAVRSFGRVLALEPENDDATWFVGLAAARAGETEKAARLWSGLLGRLPPEDPRAAVLRSQLEGLDGDG